MRQVKIIRNQNQTIRIDDNVIITVLGTDGDEVLLSIEAPNHISVSREEIYIRRQQKQQQQVNMGELDVC